MTDTTERDEIAAKTGIPASLLRGDTRAELEHHAAQLADAGFADGHLTPEQIVDAATGRTSGLPADVDDTITQALGR